MEPENDCQLKPDALALEPAAAENPQTQAEAGAESESADPEDRERLTNSDWRAMIPHDDSTMLDIIVAFLRRYLVCDEHQLHLLALWIVHTWTHDEDVATAAYLDIRSPEPESGKTRCLELLNLLSQEPWLASGPSPGTVRDKLLENRSLEQIQRFMEEIEQIGEQGEEEGEEETEEEAEEEGVYLSFPNCILLDDCHHLFGPSERQQVLAILNSGSRRTSRYVFGDQAFWVFRPMAFAGNARLPRSLAARCIPIVLRRKKPSDIVARFHPDQARSEAEAGQILSWLEVTGSSASWHQALIAKGPPALPRNWVLTAHQEDCAEPLLQIADAIGGPWPERARAAIVACFSLAEHSPPLQLLADIRAWFRINDDPEYLLSRDLLPLLGSMEHRPWAGWNSNSGRKLGHILRPFAISSRRVTTGDDPGVMCYHLKDFEDAWERYLPQAPTSEPVTAAGDSVTVKPEEVSSSGGA